MLYNCCSWKECLVKMLVYYDVCWKAWRDKVSVTHADQAKPDMPFRFDVEWILDMSPNIKDCLRVTENMRVYLARRDFRTKSCYLDLVTLLLTTYY